MTNRAILLSSGGLDSTTVAYWLRGKNVHVVPLFFDYGQHCADTEWQTLLDVLPKEFVASTVKLSLKEVFSQSKSRLINEPDLWTEETQSQDLYIPYRTLLFFSASAAYAQTIGVTNVYSGFINSNHATEIDCSTGFLNQLDSLSNKVGAVRFIMPFRYNTKQEVAKTAVELGVPIGRTFSCQVWSDIPCGACPNCVDRLNAISEIEKIL